MNDKQLENSIEDFNNALRGLRQKIHDVNMTSQQASFKLQKVLTDSHLRTVLTWISDDASLRNLLSRGMINGGQFITR